MNAIKLYKQCLRAALLAMSLLLVTNTLSAKQTFSTDPDPQNAYIKLEAVPGERDVEYVLVKSLVRFDIKIHAALTPRLTDDIWVFSLPEGADYKLPAGGSIRIPVVFASQNEGTFEDVLALTDEFGYGVRIKINGFSEFRCKLRVLAGMEFEAAAGHEDCKKLVIHNPTDRKIEVLSIENAIERSEFKLSDLAETPFVLGPGEERTVGVACYMPSGKARESDGLVRYVYLCSEANQKQETFTKLHGTLRNLCGLRQTEELRFGPVIVGERECKRIKIANTTHQVITLYDIGIRANTPEWKLDELPELPIRLQPGDAITIAACYAPNGEAAESKAEVKTTYLCENGEHRMFATTVMAGSAGRPTCVMRQTPTIKFRTPQNTDERNCERLKFTNTGNQVVVLHSVEIHENNPNFTLIEVPELPIRIQPGASLTIGVCYTPTGNERCSRAKIVAVHSCANNLDEKRRSVTYVGGCLKNEPNDGSSAAPRDGSVLRSQNSQSVTEAELSLAITPNPAREAVRIALTGAEESSVQIFDMLGKEVYSSSITSEARWTAPTSGVYIVRVSGIDANGEEFIISKRLVINK